MGFISWCNKNIKKFKWGDMQLIKISAFFFALFLAKVWADILYLQWYWYLLISVVAAILVMVKVFGK
ncbi:hypothetical protein KY336_03885 [Candidatus Woesearchaeota archaeon]|nr:hypothetical protein [Candidatus Woesearchaeota archaeon]